MITWFEIALLALAGMGLMIALVIYMAGRFAVEITVNEEVMCLFDQTWTGERNDRLYAWYRVREYVQAWPVYGSRRNDLLDAVDRQIEIEKRHMNQEFERELLESRNVNVAD